MACMTPSQKQYDYGEMKILHPRSDSVLASEGTWVTFRHYPPHPCVGLFQDPQWMPETWHSTEPYMYYVFSYSCIPVIKFDL